MRSERGFVLVDSLLAICLMGIALMAVTAVFISAIRTQERAAEYTVAVGLAQKQMELLKTWRKSDWERTSAVGNIAWQGSEELPLKLNGILYQVKTEVAVWSSQLVAVTVSVSCGSRPELIVELVNLFER